MYDPTFAAGDPVTICGYSDRTTGTVTKVTAKSVTVRNCKQVLLNGASSGEPDALVMTPGGFSAHTSGVQRWEVTDNPQGGTQVFRLRKSGRWVNAAGERLIEGHRPHYDFNF